MVTHQLVTSPAVVKGGNSELLYTYMLLYEYMTSDFLIVVKILPFKDLFSVYGHATIKTHNIKINVINGMLVYMFHRVAIKIWWPNLVINVAI